MFLSNAEYGRYKHVVEKNLALQTWPGLEGLEERHVLHALAHIGIPPGSIESIAENHEPPVKTNGKWYLLTLAEAPLRSLAADPKVWEEASQCDWKPAMHSTAITNLPAILTKGIKPGPNAISKNGAYRAHVYCEGMHRAHCSFFYSTHVAIPGINPRWWFGAMCELNVDRKRGGTNHNQWEQQQGSAHLSSVHIHVADICRAYEKSPDYKAAGTYRVHQYQYATGLRGLAPKGHANQYLRDARTYSPEEV